MSKITSFAKMFLVRERASTVLRSLCVVRTPDKLSFLAFASSKKPGGAFKFGFLRTCRHIFTYVDLCVRTLGMSR